MSIAKLVSLVALAGLAAVPLAAQEGPGAAGRSVTVTGMAEVSAAPDMATLAIGVEETRDSAADALDAIANAIAPVLDRLAELGLESRDVRTSALDLAPVYRRDPNDPSRAPVADGFRASTTLSVRVRDIGRLGALLDAVVGDGANRLGSLSFGLQDESALLAEARRAAVADALAKARLYAEAAGATLGPVRTIVEAGGGLPHPAARQMMAAEAMDGMPIAEGEITLSAMVSVTVELAD